MVWIYLQAAEGQPLHSLVTLRQYPTVKSTPTINKDYFAECQKVNSLLRQFGTILQPSKDGSYVGLSTLYLPLGHAREIARRVLTEAIMTHVQDCYKRSCVWPQKSGHRLYSLKTSLASEINNSTLLGKEWPASGIILNGTLYPLRRSGPIISEKGSSRWPTLTAMDSAKKPMPSRKKTLKESGKITGGQCPPLISVIGGPIHPHFAEALMLYPIGWTELTVWGKQLFPTKQEKHLKD